MQAVQFYRDADLPFFELKLCDACHLSYKKHAHEEYSLGIVDYGKSSFWYGGKVSEVCPKTVVLIPPGVVHSCNPQAENQWRYKMLFIDAAWIKTFFENKGLRAAGCPVVKDMSDAQAFAAMNEVVESLTSPSSPLEKEASIMALLEQVVKDMNQVPKNSQPQELPKLTAIKDYLQDNFLKKVTLEELEQISGLSKFNIIRSFKEEFAIPPHTYQTLLRINYAKRQLRQCKHIVEVAYEAGFYDQSHFNKVFKSHTGVTPEKYQKLR
ncbi:AraC family transcriptional regulator [Sporomusa sp.]|uniref:AraC family transcriptional regulator n=1 Tax=Sporomusa sp. TaxID=2078658 RepID=UPI002D15FD46|nr:AraC family transcriptional regulator [Sporomusa sp.]HWR42377.1 AraC family transcriptional regulator [Sporomusa sp.]